MSTRLFTGALASAAIASLFVGCSKGDDTELVDGVEPTLPGEDSSVIVVASDAQRPPLDASLDAKADGDAGKKDADAEAGPQGPPPNPGDPCPVPNTVIKRPCGLCGHEEAMCLLTEAGTGIVSDFAGCLNQVLNGCIPGQTQDIACGNCGKAKRTCNSSCAWSTSVCQQPPNSCVAGTIEYSTAGCPQPNTFRRRDCKTDCTWGPFAATCAAPMNDHVLTAPTTVAGTQKLTVTLVPTKVDKMLDWLGGCPNTGSFDLGNYAYEYVEIKNPSSLKATVTIYLSQAPGGVALDTIMAVYEGGMKPMTDAQRLACKWGVADQSYSDTALTGSSDFSIQKNVVIPANGSVMLWVSTYPEVDPLDPTDSTGPFIVNVRLDALN